MKRINKFLIVLVVAIVSGGIYFYFLNSPSDEIIPKAYGSTSSLVSSSAAESISSLVSSAGVKISSDISFLTSLVSLKKIVIDTSLFEDNSFSSLKNNAVTIDKMEPGRVNPFAPISASKIKSATESSSKVVTGQATQITGSSAVLNGTVNVNSGITSLYFEYGKTNELGTTTLVTQQSLVGGFIKGILGLSSKTNYFYKACAKINSTVSCGDVVSFTTN